MPSRLRPARFGFETGSMAPGWHTGGTWNGFAVPYFDASQVETAIEVLQGVGLEVHREGGSAVIIDDPESGTSDRYEATRIDGRRFWKLDGFTWLLAQQRAREVPARGRMREQALDIPGWRVGYHADISAHAAVRRIPGKRDWIFVMTTPEDHEPRSLDDEAVVGLYYFDGDDWEQVGSQDFPDVSSVIKLNDAELQLVIEHALSMDQARDLLVQEFDEWEESDGEASIMPWMATILKDAGVQRPEREFVESAAHEAIEQIRNASPAQILAYMNARSEAINE